MRNQENTSSKIVLIIKTKPYQSSWVIALW